MLVCNVSLRPPGRTIAAEVAEIALADDASTTGLVVFATLVDDPASVGDIVDAYLGEIMLETASAADIVSVGLIYSADIVAAVTATDAHDATTTSAITTTTWNPSDKLGITLSNGNLTATGSGSGTPDRVRAIAGYTTGKYYCEITMATWNNGSTAVGAALSTATGQANVANAVGLAKSGVIVVNGTNTGIFLGANASGDIICIAADLGAHLIWFRLGATGNWNANSSNNPATGTGGINISSLSGALYPYFTPWASTDVATANFGASAFSGTVPSGFTAGW